jgi:hypothetical protein
VVDRTYIRALEAHLVGAVALARRETREAHLGLGVGRVDTISENRRSGQDVTDPAVPVLRFDDDAGGQPIAVLTNFACHPVTLHSYGNRISPDYPGTTRSVVRSVLGENVAVLFTLGSAGDVNPAGYVAGETTPQRSRQVGAILGCEVAKVALEVGHAAAKPLRVAHTVLELPVEPLPPVAELEQMHDRLVTEVEQLRAAGCPWSERSVAEIQRDWAADALRAWESSEPRYSVACEIQAVRLGSAALVAAPLEIFTETGLAIKRGSPAQATLVVSNANGGLGYLPTRDAYETKDYTNPQGLAPKVYGLYALSPGAEPLFRQAVIGALEALF